MNDWKDRLGVVFSTNPDYAYQSESDEPDTPTLAPSAQKLRVSTERAHRGGKTVTLVRGFVGTDDDLAALARRLKTSCGVGGTAKDGEIVIQGDFRQRIIDLLKASGYTSTR